MSINDRVVVQSHNRYRSAPQLDLGALLGVSEKGANAVWTWADESTLAAAVVNWTGAGNAITFGRTSDGGALSISLLSGGKPFKLYAASPEELNEHLARIASLDVR